MKMEMGVRAEGIKERGRDRETRGSMKNWVAGTRRNLRRGRSVDGWMELFGSEIGPDPKPRLEMLRDGNLRMEIRWL